MKKYTVIARTGTFRDSNGIRRIFTKDDLKKIAENYNSSTTDAPLVIGHVQNDSAPAYGWIEELIFKDEKLCASFSYVSEEIKNLVYKGAYRNVSMSVDMENHRLLHVALLGGVAPAIDGLGAINLSHNTNESVYTFSFETKEENMNETELKKRIEELPHTIISYKSKNSLTF